MTNPTLQQRIATLENNLIKGKDIAPQVLKILMRTENEKEVLKNVMDL